MRFRPTLARRVALVLLVSSTALSAGCASRAAEVPFLPPSRPAQFSFAGIPWGIGADSVTALVEPRGYNFNSLDADGDMVFDGMLMRTPTRVYAFLAEQRLVKFRVSMMTPDETALSTYASARAELVKQYGQPRESVEEYEAPYKKGDQRQLEAFRKGKATMRSYWQVGTGTRQQHVTVFVTDRLTVIVDYDGPAWDKESMRRRRAEPASR